jgi:hypothetical protein
VRTCRPLIEHQSCAQQVLLFSSPAFWFLLRRLMARDGGRWREDFWW